MTFRSVVARFVAALSLALPCASPAAPIDYDFTIAWTSGALAGTTSHGNFAFDSSIAQPGEQYALDLIDNFDLQIRDVHFDETRVKSLFLGFDVNSRLNAFITAAGRLFRGSG